MITPVYKSDDRKFFGNYRPISILPIFSKILERIIYNRLLAYLDKMHILSSNQYGFRKNYSTYMALIELIDSLSHSIDNNEYTIGIFVDLSKAFDTVDHKILISKLNHYGIRGTPLMWFKDYLSDRKQTVKFNETVSSKMTVTCGVPQVLSLDHFYFFFTLTILPIALIFSILFCLLMILVYIIPTEILPHLSVKLIVNLINCRTGSKQINFRSI